jgi:hypothetical protein
MDDYSEKILKSATTFLSRWNGADAELWELTVSLRTLSVLIRHLEQPGNLVIACIDPQFIRSSLRWQNCQLRASRVERYDGERDGFGLYDDVADVEILCGKLEIKENVKLW